VPRRKLSLKKYLLGQYGIPSTSFSLINHTFSEDESSAWTDNEEMTDRVYMPSDEEPTAGTKEKMKPFEGAFKKGKTKRPGRLGDTIISNNSSNNLVV
jgi:hypothetical protein